MKNDMTYGAAEFLDRCCFPLNTHFLLCPNWAHSSPGPSALPNETDPKFGVGGVHSDLHTLACGSPGPSGVTCPPPTEDFTIDQRFPVLLTSLSSPIQIREEGQAASASPSALQQPLGVTSQSHRRNTRKFDVFTDNLKFSHKGLIITMFRQPFSATTFMRTYANVADLPQLGKLRASLDVTDKEVPGNKAEEGAGSQRLTLWSTVAFS
ncbi:hypothetical protein AGIG_G13812 [Arapaima gigas]